MIIYHILLNIINIGPVIDLSDSTRVSMGKYEIVGEVAIYMVIFKGYSYYNVIYIYMYLYDLDKCRTFDPLLNIVGLVDALDPLRCAKIAKLHCH